MIMVDPAWHWFRQRRWCHMASDASLDELHAFARLLGLPAEAFQDNPKRNHPHYDLDEALRAEAVRLGAVEVSSKYLARHMVRYDDRAKPNWLGE